VRPSSSTIPATRVVFRHRRARALRMGLRSCWPLCLVRGSHLGNVMPGMERVKRVKRRRGAKATMPKMRRNPPIKMMMMMMVMLYRPHRR
jgi:hypothetical protein